MLIFIYFAFCFRTSPKFLTVTFISNKKLNIWYSIKQKNILLPIFISFNYVICNSSSVSYSIKPPFPSSDDVVWIKMPNYGTGSEAYRNLTGLMYSKFP